MPEAKRIQRKRTKGWKMPKNTVYVGRPTKWGNPWELSACGTRRKCVRLYRAWLVGTFTEKSIERILANGKSCPKQPLAMLRWLMIRGGLRNMLSELRGKNLACWCPLCSKHATGKPFTESCSDCSPCHCDVLGEIANA